MLHDTKTNVLRAIQVLLSILASKTGTNIDKIVLGGGGRDLKLTRDQLKGQGLSLLVLSLSRTVANLPLM